MKLNKIETKFNEELDFNYTVIYGDRELIESVCKHVIDSQIKVNTTIAKLKAVISKQEDLLLECNAVVDEELQKEMEEAREIDRRIDERRDER